jgi:hypothetical protein
MKWFIVMIMVNSSGHLFGVVEDNMPYDTPTKCEREAAKLQATRPDAARNGLRVMCAANNVAADFAFGMEK